MVLSTKFEYSIQKWPEFCSNSIFLFNPTPASHTRPQRSLSPGCSTPVTSQIFCPCIVICSKKAFTLHCMQHPQPGHCRARNKTRYEKLAQVVVSTQTSSLSATLASNSVFVGLYAFQKTQESTLCSPLSSKAPSVREADCGWSSPQLGNRILDGKITLPLQTTPVIIADSRIFILIVFLPW